MAAAYLNQCMSNFVNDDNSESSPRRKQCCDADKSGEGYAKDSDSHDGIDDLSTYGLKSYRENSSLYPSRDNMSDTAGDGSGKCMDTVSSEKDSLVAAIKSLEKTINNHCILLSKKFSPPQHSTANRKRPSIVPAVNSLKQSMSDFTISPSKVSLPVKGETERGDRVTVYIRVVFLKIGEIDTMKENFAADAFVQAKWREPALDNGIDVAEDEIEWDRYWNPKLYVENNLGEPKETVWQAVRFDMKGEAMVYERRRIKGCFLENLELDEFPFDTQDLTLTITSERSEAEIDIEEDHSEISSINIQSFVDEQEWKLHSHVETWKRVTTRIYHNSKYKHPAISTSCRASRRPGFYIWNIFLVMLFICSLAFGTFTVDLKLPQNRLQLSFILLLTTITFKFVVSQTLPKIPYLTYMDKYILTSMGILCAVCVWHSVAPLVGETRVAIVADRWALGLLGGSYVAFHLVFFLYIYFVALKKRWKYNEKDHEHKERMRKLQRMQEKEWSDINSLRIDAL